MVETNKQIKNSTECIPFSVTSLEIYSVKEQNFAAWMSQSHSCFRFLANSTETEQQFSLGRLIQSTKFLKVEYLALEIIASLKQNVRFIHAVENYHHSISINCVGLANNHSPVTSLKSCRKKIQHLNIPCTPTKEECHASADIGHFYSVRVLPMYQETQNVT